MEWAARQPCSGSVLSVGGARCLPIAGLLGGDKVIEASPTGSDGARDFVKCD